jgi:hypothetical protein
MKRTGGALPARGDASVVGRGSESGCQQEPDAQTYVSHERTPYHGHESMRTELIECWSRPRCFTSGSLAGLRFPFH